MKISPLIKYVIALSPLIVNCAHAIELTDDGSFSLRGFGTLGFACFSSGRYDFIRENRPHGPGKTKECDTGIDSNLGVQVDGNLTQDLQFTGQSVSYHRADNTFEPELTQANLRWNFAENYYLRLGRMQGPVSMTSEYRNIAHAQTWVRAPVELYKLASGFTIDGIELVKMIELSHGWDLNLRGGLANTDIDISRLDGTHNTDNFNLKFGYVDARLANENWLIKSTLASGVLDYATPALTRALGAFGTNKQLAQNLSYHDKTMVLVSIGTRYETNDWLVQTEYAFRDLDVHRSQQAAYLMVGYHLDGWTPYSILARAWSETLGKEKKAPNAFQYSVANSLVNSSIDDRTSLALGLSRKLCEEAILKFQIDFIRPDPGTPKPYDIEHLTTLNLDFVF